MTTLTVTPAELREILGPVRPWCDLDPSAPEATSFVRIFAAGGWTYATATNARGIAASRTEVAAPGFDCLIHVDDVDHLLRLAEPGSDVRHLEISDGPRRLNIAAHYDVGTLRLFDCHTREPGQRVPIGPIATRILTSEHPTPAAISSADTGRIARAVDCYAHRGEAGAAAVTLVADAVNVPGFTVAAHLDRFLALLPTAARDVVPGTGMTNHRYGARALGPALLKRDPLTHWPTVLQEVSL